MTEANTDVGGKVQETIEQGIKRVTDQVAAKLGTTQASALAPVIAQYGAAFAAMTAKDIWGWIDLAAKGDPYKSYAAILAKLPNRDLGAEWGSINAQMQTSNIQNSAALAWQRDAVGAVLKGLVAIAASMVVL